MANFRVRSSASAARRNASWAAACACSTLRGASSAAASLAFASRCFFTPYPVPTTPKKIEPRVQGETPESFLVGRGEVRSRDTRGWFPPRGGRVLGVVWPDVLRPFAAPVRRGRGTTPAGVALFFAFFLALAIRPLKRRGDEAEA